MTLKFLRYFLTLLMKLKTIVYSEHLCCCWDWYIAKTISCISPAFAYLGTEKLGTRTRNFDIMLYDTALLLEDILTSMLRQAGADM